MASPAAPPAPEEPADPAVPWMLPELFITKVPPILVGAVRIPIVVPELIVYTLAILSAQLPELALSNSVFKLALDAAEAVTATLLDYRTHQTYQ